MAAPWFVIHVYSGFEKKVAGWIKEQAQQRGMAHLVGEVLVPTDSVVEVRKGNKKVKVELYGRVNRVINFWNDGAESNVYSLNSSYNTDRFGIRGKGKISDDWSSGFVIEIEDTGNQSRSLNKT